ncbi:MAG TPA: pitrilysin family protein [Phycisphaerales bacterium]|nr:pitrilysin family protein [Phycisphaerales bacterium]
MPVTFQKETLPNGLTIVAETDPDAHTAAAGFFVKTGARDEDPSVMGVSHFLEHMMFKGTTRRSADDVNRHFDEIGASYNAYTSSELTCFHACVLPERLPQATDILADILRPALRQSDYDTEKGVILEEIAMYKDQPFWVLYEAAMDKYYAPHPLAHRVLGTEDTIKALTRDQMQTYFDHRYSADNTTVALAGRLDFKKTVEHIASLCGNWKRTGAKRAMGDVRAHSGDFEHRDPKVNRAYLLMVAPGPAISDDRRYAAMMLTQVLGEADNSRLHWALVEPGIAEEVQAAYDPRDGCGDFYVFASCDPDRLPEIRAIIDREIINLPNSLTESDLERLRNKLATGITLAGERPDGRMQRLGRNWTYLGACKTLEEELARINAVTLKEMKAVYEAFPFTPRMVGTTRPA